MASSTALAYQMMIEEKLLGSMINAEQRGHFHIAAAYARVHADFLGVKELPPQPIGSKTAEQEYAAQTDYYFKLLGVIGSTAKKTLEDVREKYGKQKPTGIPGVSK